MATRHIRGRQSRLSPSGRAVGARVLSSPAVKARFRMLAGLTVRRHTAPCLVLPRVILKAFTVSADTIVALTFTGPVGRIAPARIGGVPRGAVASVNQRGFRRGRRHRV